MLISSTGCGKSCLILNLIGKRDYKHFDHFMFTIVANERFDKHKLSSLQLYGEKTLKPVAIFGSGNFLS